MVIGKRKDSITVSSSIHIQAKKLVKSGSPDEARAFVDDLMAQLGEQTEERRNDIIDMTYHKKGYSELEASFSEKFGFPILSLEAKRATLNEGHYHEVIDRTHVLLCMLDDHIATHPAVLFNPELSALVDKATDALGDLYQAAARLNEAEADAEAGR